MGRAVNGRSSPRGEKTRYDLEIPSAKEAGLAHSLSLVVAPELTFEVGKSPRAKAYSLKFAGHDREQDVFTLVQGEQLAHAAFFMSMVLYEPSRVLQSKEVVVEKVAESKLGDDTIWRVDFRLAPAGSKPPIRGAWLELNATKLWRLQRYEYTHTDGAHWLGEVEYDDTAAVSAHAVSHVITRFKPGENWKNETICRRTRFEQGGFGDEVFSPRAFGMDDLLGEAGRDPVSANRWPIATVSGLSLLATVLLLRRGQPA